MTTAPQPRHRRPLPPVATPAFNGTHTEFYIGSIKDTVASAFDDTDVVDGFSPVHIDEFRIKDTYDADAARDPGADRYFSGSGATFTSVAFPNSDTSVQVPLTFERARQIPHGTQLGTLSWTEFLPTHSSGTGTTGSTRAIVQVLDSGGNAAKTSTTPTTASGGQITDSSGPIYVNSPNVRIRYVLTLVAGGPETFTFAPPLTTTVATAEYLMETPIVDDVTVTLLTPVRVLRHVELAE